MRITQHILEVFSYCPQPTDQKKQSNIKYVACTCSTTRRSTRVCYPFHCMKVSTNSCIGSQRVSHPAARHTRHSQQQMHTGLCRMCTAHVRIQCVFLLPKMENETSLKMQSLKALPAHPDCFLDHSRNWLPEPAPFPSPKLWHSSSLDKRHPAQSKSVSRCNGQKQPNRHLLMNLSKSALAVDKIFLQLHA